jgi:enediyne biosynthesis protein E4
MRGFLTALLLAVLACGCRNGRGAATGAAPATTGAPAASIRFADVADARGVRFKHTNGASGRLYLAETMGSGCAFLDYDGDGRLDLFLVNSSRLPGFQGRGPYYPALFHQRPDGTFEDVTRRVGLDVDCYGMGCAVGDYDNDGRPDLYLTAYGGCRLFHNNGTGGPRRFSEVTRHARAPGPAWGTSAAWLDFDRDGFLDLFVCSYCRWSPAANQSCGDICGPKYYPGTASVLYHNNRDGTFTDVTRRAHVDVPDGKALGVTAWDEDGDGWVDFAVANDTVPNWLFRNNRDGTFTEAGVEAGIAYAPNGQARAGMGVDIADPDDSGREALLIGNNASEGLGFYRPEAPAGTASAAHWSDAAAEVGLLEPSMPFSTFGALFVDLDQDGFVDIVTANGHINQHQARLGGGTGLAQRMLLFLNEPGDRPGMRRFREVGAAAGNGLSTPRVARGLAASDVDGDGDPDLLVCANNGRAVLLQNEGRNGNHWLAIRPRGVKSNRDGLGTRVVLRAAGRTESAWVRSGSSYCSDGEHVARFGLGQAAEAESIALHWPSGIVQTLRHVRADQLLQVTEAASP